MRRAPVVGLVVLACGCASVLGIDKDYREVNGGPGVGDATTDDGGDATADDASGDGAGDGGSDAPFDGTPYAALSAGDVRLYYTRTSGALEQRTWSHAGKAWAPAVKLGDLASPYVPWTAPAIAPGSGAELVGAFASNADASTLTTFLGEPGWPVGFAAGPLAISTPQSARRAFDVIYTAASNDTLAVYGDGTSSPKVRRRHGGAWGAEQAVLASPPGVAAVDWIELVAHPRTDEVTLLYTDVSRRLYAVVWSGTAWGAASTLDTTGLNYSEFPSFTGAYENVSGDFLAVWSRPSTCGGGVNPLYFATKAQGASTLSAPVTSAGALGAPGPMVLASEPGTDRIALSAVEYGGGVGLCCYGVGCSDYGAGTWDGSAWSSLLDLDGAIGTAYMVREGTMPTAVGWLGTSGTAVAVYSKTPAGALAWAKATGTDPWTLQTPAAMTPPLLEQVDFQMVRIPSIDASIANDALVLVLEDINGSLWAKLYDGVAWVDMNAGAPLADGVRVTPGVPFGVVVR